VKRDAAKSRTPILDTYAVTAEERPEWPDVRRFILPDQKRIIKNLAAPEGKIDMIIRTDCGGCAG
jgi:hypothetical protein